MSIRSMNETTGLKAALELAQGANAWSINEGIVSCVTFLRVPATGEQMMEHRACSRLPSYPSQVACCLSKWIFAGTCSAARFDEGGTPALYVALALRVNAALPGRSRREARKPCACYHDQTIKGEKMEESHTSLSEEKGTDLSFSEYLSVEEAAHILGVSTRAVYWYIEQGRLSCTRGDIYLLHREEVAAFERRAPGQVRARTPCWRVPPAQNALSLTTITVRVRPGQRTSFTEKLAAMYQEGTHTFPGTAARYVTYHQQDPDEITILLIWRSANQLAHVPRHEALVALMADLAEVLDWNTAQVQECHGLLHA